MKLPVNVQTQKGHDFYFFMIKQFDFIKRVGDLNWYKNYLTIRNSGYTAKLTKWLKEHEVETVEEKQFWKEQADKIAVRNYFINRKDQHV